MDIQSVLNQTKETMEKAVKHTAGELAKVRAGKASPSMLDGIHVNYYGTSTPLSQVASINTPDARTITIKPWEKNLLSEIEKAIKDSDLNLNPQNDGDMIRINLPSLTEERRKDLVKQAKNETESGKVRIRTIRKESNEELKGLLKKGVSEDDVKNGEEKIQQLTDSYTKKIEELFAVKEKEIMTV